MESAWGDGADAERVWEAFLMRRGGYFHEGDCWMEDFREIWQGTDNVVGD